MSGGCRFATRFYNFRAARGHAGVENRLHFVLNAVLKARSTAKSPDGTRTNFPDSSTPPPRYTRFVALGPR